MHLLLKLVLQPIFPWQWNTNHQGNEYNTAIDNNPRYNEDCGVGDAVVSNQNVYYQLRDSADDKQGDKKNLSSDNGNVYYQLWLLKTSEFSYTIGWTIKLL